eukprot:CAMPEP_0114989530 /NCGR_PEP_ID=MMETSP0216-20121206/10252_1 /TAXON_ID=223996 /ORGANISM="Protocruzia adherens, Strain Boccale" /LENGTH=325 /DNA_ID=CAMNT_0002352525 /DNA_START=34 /DNA_END=1007 /DNA_ORIENTATION=+
MAGVFMNPKALPTKSSSKGGLDFETKKLNAARDKFRKQILDMLGREKTVESEELANQLEDSIYNDLNGDQRAIRERIRKLGLKMKKQSFSDAVKSGQITPQQISGSEFDSLTASGQSGETRARPTKTLPATGGPGGRRSGPLGRGRPQPTRAMVNRPFSKQTADTTSSSETTSTGNLPEAFQAANLSTSENLSTEGSVKQESDIQETTPRDTMPQITNETRTAAYTATTEPQTTSLKQEVEEEEERKEQTRFLSTTTQPTDTNLGLENQRVAHRDTREEGQATNQEDNNEEEEEEAVSESVLKDIIKENLAETTSHHSDPQQSLS